jgi:hypothetical protein
MGVKILCDHKEILDVKRSTFEIFYNDLIELIENDNIVLNESLQELMQKLSLGCYGFGIDIADFIKNKNDGLFFADLVKKTIIIFEAKFIDLYESKSRLLNFHKEILNYAEELP